MPIPEALAQEFGIHKGVRIDWERTEDGGLRLRTVRSRAERARELLGAGKKYLQPDESGVEAFLKWREEDARLDGSL